MNPLLDDSQQELRRAAQEAVEANVASIADRIETEGVLPRAALGSLADGGLLSTGLGEADRRLRSALVVEQVARKSAALASVVAVQSAAIDALAAAGVETDELTAGRRVVAIVANDVEADADGRLTGSVPMVCAADGCDEFLVVATGDGAGLYRVAFDQVAIDGEAGGLLGLNGSGAADVELEEAAGERIGDEVAARALQDGLRILTAAVGVGIGRGSLDAAVAEVASRKEAGDRIDRSQAVQWMLADIATETEAARAATWNAACATAPASREEASAICRLLAAEAAVESARRALQIFGAHGARRSTGVERLFRDAKVLEMQGGSNEEQLARIAAHVLPDLAGA